MHQMRKEIHLAIRILSFDSIETLRRFAARVLVISATGLALAAAVIAQNGSLSISYQLAMSQPSSHLFEVSIEVQKPYDYLIDSLDFQMPKWSPGRYAVFDFAKNVQEIRTRAACTEEKLADPPLKRIDDQTWQVDLSSFKYPTFRCATGHLRIFFDYKVFANDLSGTFSQLDSRHANFNGHSIFMYVVNHKPKPVSLSIKAPKGWRIVNGRTEKEGQSEFQFTNWDIMTDTPTEIAPDWTQDSFTVDGKQYHVVLHAFGKHGNKRPALVRDIEKIVRAEIAMWGPPEFDAYTFLIHFANDGHSGDGMEHLTSTQIIMPGELADATQYEEALATAAHEFFHVWNVKRLRPIELGPWDFTRPLNTRSLWIAEGITNYYGHLMMRRAGLWNDAKFLKTLTEQISDVDNSPGSKLMSAEASSLSAPFIDDAPHAQETNLANTSISYYPKGEIIGVVLDLLIRGNTRGRASLDHVMRRMYEEFYLKSANASYYLRGRGYRHEDFERTVSDVLGSDMSDFFRRYVRGVETPPYEEAFAKVGLKFIREPRGPVTVGISADENVKNNFKIADVRPNSPAAIAGLEEGDVITSFGGVKLTPANLVRTVNRYKPNDRVPVVLQRDGKIVRVTITMGEPLLFNYRIEEDPNASAEAKALRAAWLKGK
jgi:predicted metalloprotease with PDZ domain